MNNTKGFTQLSKDEFDKLNSMQSSHDHHAPKHSNEIIKNDDSPDDSNEFMVDMINNFMTNYRFSNMKPKNMTLFDGIEMNDPTSTNMIIEEFYEELLKFKMNDSSDSEHTKLYKYSDICNITKKDQYKTILENGIPIVASQSFFALLIEMTNLKNEDITGSVDYRIVALL